MLENILFRFPIVVLALTCHEFAHGWVAHMRGDDTAKNAGRLTFNPLAHLDPVGTFMLLFLPFGWAKPVPVNPGMMANPRTDMIKVSAAGPATNIILGILFGLAYRLLVLEGSLYDGGYIAQVLYLGTIINFGLAFFNLLPIPPLDGSRILTGFLPQHRLPAYSRVVRHVPAAFGALLLIGFVSRIPIIPLILNPLWQPFFGFWQFVVFGGKVF
jgi:Zn-dependent protease